MSRGVGTSSGRPRPIARDKDSQRRPIPGQTPQPQPQPQEISQAKSETRPPPILVPPRCHWTEIHFPHPRPRESGKRELRDLPIIQGMEPRYPLPSGSHIDSRDYIIPGSAPRNQPGEKGSKGHLPSRERKASSYHTQGLPHAFRGSSLILELPLPAHTSITDSLRGGGPPL